MSTSRIFVQAEKGKHLRAYMLDIYSENLATAQFNPFSKKQFRRVLVDEYGQVFVPNWGWSSLQNSYPLKVIGNAVEPFREEMKHADWWESKAWKCISWAWCYMQPSENFRACHVSSDGFVFAG